MGKLTNIDESVKLSDIIQKKAQAKETLAKTKEILYNVKELSKIKSVQEQDKINIDKLSTLGRLLETFTVDTERSISETKFKCIWDDEELNHLKKKIMQIIRVL